MNKRGIGLLIATALAVAQASAYAQPKKPAEGEAAEGAGGEGEAPAGEAPEGEVPEGEEPEEPDVGAGGLGDICKIDPEACPQLDMEKEATKPLREDIYAVQQEFVLKVRRVQVNPYWAFTLNDQFVSHPGPGLAVDYYFTKVLAAGLNFNYYRPFNVDSAFNAQLRRAARVAVPLTEYDWGAALNFTYVPAYGKFAGFGEFIFHYDAYVVGGIGAISTRPIAVIDPDNREFEYEPKIAFNAGIGLRIFFNRWFAAILEVRDYAFFDKLENLKIAANPRDKSTWTDETSFTNNVQAQLGVGIFIPFSFDYRLPK